MSTEHQQATQPGGHTKPKAMPKPAQGHSEAIKAGLAKSTPGPWKADDNYGCRAIRGGKSGTHKQAQYYEVACTVGLNNEAEDEANARLIAAAPDLLVACKAALVRLERLDDAGTGEHSPAYLQVQAATAKAEGRAQ